MHRTVIAATVFAILAGPAAAADCRGPTYDIIRACQARDKARQAEENRASIAFQDAARERQQAEWRAAERAKIRATMPEDRIRFFADRRKLGIAEADIAASWAEWRIVFLGLYAEPK